MTHALCIALHDVAPATWPECAALLDLLDRIGAGPITLLVVPDYHERGRVDRDPAFIRAIEQRLLRGAEIALHGYDHLDRSPAPRTPREWLRRRVLTAGEGEFAALDRAQAQQRIDRGLEIFERLGWQADGFVPPAWLASEGTRQALQAFSLRYTSTHTALLDLRAGIRIGAPCLTASPRSAWRRAASRVWLKTAERLSAHAPIVRVGLHPGDARHPELLACWRDLIARLLRTRRALTKSQAIDEAVCAAPLRC
ncbi:MAG TPA: polysaccharide deacetylase family protein [Rudaea sp.]